MKFRRLRLSTVALSLVLLSFASLGYTSPAHASSTIFTIWLMVPNSNPARQSWSLVVQSELQSLGIDAQRVILPFNTIIDRVIQANDTECHCLGLNYTSGGWDTLFIGNALAIDPDPAILYNSTLLPPTGSNYNLWNNSTADYLGTQIEQTVDRASRLNFVRQWQTVAQDQEPSATILYTKETVAFDDKMPNGQYVFQTYHFPYWPPIEQLSSNPVDSTVVLEQTGGPPANLIPELSSSYYDTTVSGMIYAALAQRNDTIFKTMIPQLASGTAQSPGWSVTPDGKNWTVTLRSGLTWQDGAPLDANDVKFTFDSIMSKALSSEVYSFYNTVIGNVTADPTHIVVVDPTTVKFNLPHPYAYFVENILGGTAILPQHILGTIPFSQWRSSSFNTGQCSSPTTPLCPTVTGPVGAGPYMYDHYDPATTTSYLVRYDNYLDFPVNGGPELRLRGAFGIKNYDVRTVVGSDQAVTDITTGAADILDSQYHLESSQYNFLQTWGASQEAVYNAYGIQEMGFNMRHRILGTGVDTPLGKQDPSKAALAAKYVRQAISHAIPRQLIIDQLLHGYGAPGITSAVTPAMDGFNTALIANDFNVTESRQLLTLAGYFPPAPAPAPSFWDTYGVYLVSALVVAIVAVSALYVLRARRRPPMPSTTMQPSAPMNPPPPS